MTTKKRSSVKDSEVNRLDAFKSEINKLESKVKEVDEKLTRK